MKITKLSWHVYYEDIYSAEELHFQCLELVNAHVHCRITADIIVSARSGINYQIV